MAQPLKKPAVTEGKKSRVKHHSYYLRVQKQVNKEVAELATIRGISQNAMLNELILLGSEAYKRQQAEKAFAAAVTISKTALTKFQTRYHKFGLV